MATRSPVAFHAYWGIFSTVGDLPNVAGAATQSNTLQVGDQAYSTADAMIYFCIDATVGAAIWSAMGLGPANFDAFGRLRVSNPQTIFDAKTVYDAQPLYFAEQQTGGAAAGVWRQATVSPAHRRDGRKRSRGRDTTKATAEFRLGTVSSWSCPAALRACTAEARLRRLLSASTKPRGTSIR